MDAGGRAAQDSRPAHAAAGPRDAVASSQRSMDPAGGARVPASGLQPRGPMRTPFRLLAPPLFWVPTPAAPPPAGAQRPHTRAHGGHDFGPAPPRAGGQA